MQIQGLVLNPKLIPYYIPSKLHDFSKTQAKHLSPSITIVRNNKNQLFRQLKHVITKQQYPIVEEKLFTLIDLSHYQQFIKMKHFSIRLKKRSNPKQQNKYKIYIYFEYFKNQVEELSLYIRRKQNNTSYIISQDVLLYYLYSLIKSLSVIQQLRYSRHGFLNMFSIYKYKHVDQLKVFFNPFQPIKCLELLLQNPQIQYYKYYLSPQELQILSQAQRNKSINLDNLSYKFSSQSDIFSIAIIILTLSSLHLNNKYCYYEYGHANAGIDQNNLDQKLSFIKEYYSKEFMSLILMMVKINEQDRIGLSQLLERINQIFRNKQQKLKKYQNTLLRIQDNKKFKSVNYKLKFPKKSQKGKVEDLKMTSEVEDAVFRGTFGKNQSNQGYYGLDHLKYQEQQQHIPKKIQKTKSTEKKNKDNDMDKYKKIKTKQNKDEQSTQKKKKQKFESSQKKINKQQQQQQKQKQSAYDPSITDLAPKFKQFESKSTNKKNKNKDKDQKHNQPKQKTKSNFKGKQKFQSQNSSQNQKSSLNLSQSVLPQMPQQIYIDNPSISFNFNLINPEDNQKQLFQVSSYQFPNHLIQFFEYKVPQKKYFKPQNAEHLAKRFHTQGIMIANNIYYGDCKEGRRQGLGLNIFPEGDYYYGYYDQDLMHGKGIYWWKPIQYFIGQFHYGKKLKGWMINGSKTYYGSYLNNQKTGRGINFQQNSVFQGSWQKGKREGEGIIFYHNGDMFKGIWRDGKKNGPGLQKKYSTKIQIQGEWRDDIQISPVEVKYPNKHVYKGQYKNGQKTGKGEYYFHNGTKFQGVFLDDDCYEGSFHFSNNSIYSGKVNKALKRQGYGTNIDQNGDKYEGDWMNDFKHGNGKYQTATETMTGVWREGELWQGNIVDSLGNYYKVQAGKAKKYNNGQVQEQF